MSVQQQVQTTKSKYRPEIDGLRAFAVVAVIINHFDKSLLPGGYLGVDIFFVISGYVITSSLFGRPSRNFRDFISGFYERRIKRLVPALAVFVVLTSIAICLFSRSPGTSLKTGFYSLFGLSNLYLFRTSTDYFAQSTELNAFTHTWSLGVEEQFYILFPFLIWFSGFGSQAKKGARNLFLVVGVLTIASLIGFIYFYPANQPAAYFLMPSRFWEMAAGCLIFIAFQKRSSIESFLEKFPPSLILVLIIAVMYLPLHLSVLSTIAVVLLSSVLIASLKENTAVFQIFAHRKVVYVGLISYSLYLWHWGILSVSRWTIGIHWWSIPFQLMAMFGMAVASYHWVETPLRKRNWFVQRWKTLVLGGGVLALVSAGSFGLNNVSHMIYLGRKKIDYQQYKCIDLLGKIVDDASNVKCYSFLVNGDKEPSSNVWIFGDSMSGWANGPEIALELSRRLKQSVHVISNAANPYPSLVYTHNKRHINAAIRSARDWEEMMERLLPSISEGDSVVLFNRTLHRFSGWENQIFSDGTSQDRNMLYHFEGKLYSPSEALEIHLEKLENFSSLLNSKKATLHVVGSFHDLTRTPVICLEKNWFTTPQCTSTDPNIVPLDATLYAKNFSNEYAVKLAKSGFTVVDVFGSLCPGEQCGSVVNGSIIFADKAHFSSDGARLVGSKIAESLLVNR